MIADELIYVINLHPPTQITAINFGTNYKTWIFSISMTIHMYVRPWIYKMDDILKLVSYVSLYKYEIKWRFQSLKFHRPHLEIGIQRLHRN